LRKGERYSESRTDGYESKNMWRKESDEDEEKLMNENQKSQTPMRPNNKNEKSRKHHLEVQKVGLPPSELTDSKSFLRQRGVRRYAE